MTQMNISARATAAMRRLHNLKNRHTF